MKNIQEIISLKVTNGKSNDKCPGNNFLNVFKELKTWKVRAMENYR
jgi:hypothetical protein